MYYCQVDCFLVPREIYTSDAAPMRLLRSACRNWSGKVRIRCLKPVRPDSWVNYAPGQEEKLTYEAHESAVGPKRLEERHTMIEAADIILCRVTEAWRSGLSYARKKRVPVISLANRNLAAEREETGRAYPEAATIL